MDQPPASPNHVVDARSFRYFRVEDAIFEQGLSPYAFTAYAFLCRCADSKGMSYPSQALMVKRTKMGLTRLKAALNELLEAKLVTWESGKEAGGINTYVVQGVAAERLGVVAERLGVDATRLGGSRHTATEGLHREGQPIEGLLTTLSGTPDEAQNGKRPEYALLEFLNRKAAKHFRPVEANLRLIRARLREATPDQIRAVIGLRCRKWAGDPKMSEYMRPETLFNATKFAQYLGELPATAFSPEEPDGD